MATFVVTLIIVGFVALMVLRFTSSKPAKGAVAAPTQWGEVGTLPTDSLPNPATGLTMLNGFDAAGNPFGLSDEQR